MTRLVDGQSPTNMRGERRLGLPQCLNQIIKLKRAISAPSGSSTFAHNAFDVCWT